MKGDSRTIVRFTTKGQIVIPASLRKHFEIRPGTRADISVTEEGILLRPIGAAALRRARGILRSKPGEPELKEERRSHKQEERTLEERREKLRAG